MDSDDILSLINKIVGLGETNTQLRERLDSQAKELRNTYAANASLQQKVLEAGGKPEQMKALEMANATIYAQTAEISELKARIEELNE